MAQAMRAVLLAIAIVACFADMRPSRMGGYAPKFLPPRELPQAELRSVATVTGYASLPSL